MPRGRFIKRSALRVDQHPEHPLFLFTLTGDDLLKLADVWHATRNPTGSLEGYQRPEARRHIRDITQYLDGDDVLFPNPIILALTSEIAFEAERVSSGQSAWAMPGTLEIPVPDRSAKKPAWVVDGQQRMMALSHSQRRSDLVVPVNAFVADDVGVQREQFIRVNSTKPLPRGLVAELLPQVAGPLPDRLESRRVPSLLCDMLNQELESPFFGIIWRSSMSREAKRRTVVRDTAVLRMLETSLHSPSGCLFPYQNVATGEFDSEPVRRTLLLYWNAVKHTFPDAWGRPPTESRLMHGAGIRAMGRLMDRIMKRVPLDDPKARLLVRKELRRVRSECRWTGGYWAGIGLRWREIQNTPNHVQRLGDFLVASYLDA